MSGVTRGKIARVKYLVDDSKVNVPTDFFKVIVDNTLTVEELDIGSVYKVFWSEDDNDSPREIIMNGNQVLDVEDLPQLEKQRRARAKQGHLAGYYRGLLLGFSSKDEPDRELKRELSESNCLTPGTKRLRAPSHKAIESKLNSGKLAPAAAEAVSSRKANKAVVANVQAATQRNLEELFVKCRSKGKGSKPKTVHPKPMEDSDDDKDPLYVPEETSMDKPLSDLSDGAYWKKLYEKEKEKNREKKEKGEAKYHSSKHSKDKMDSRQLSSERASKTMAIEKSPSNQMFSKHCGEKLQSPPMGNQDSPESSPSKEVSPQFPEWSDLENDVPDSLETSHQDNNKQEPKKKLAENAPKNGPSAGESSDAPTGQEMNRKEGSPSEEKASKSSSFRVRKKKGSYKPGIDGDSLFIFDQAGELWTKDDLVIRSPTGLPPSNKKNAVAYPQMTPQKVEECKAKLRERILQENKDVSETELKLRLDRVEYILGQKIQSTRASFKRRNLSFPSAEDLKKS